jgi:hypothetical protein
MSLEGPGPEVVRAVEGAVAWLKAARLTGPRVEAREDPRSPIGRDRVVVKGPAAPPLWARFSETGSNRPLFADRDGVARYSLAEIGPERRNGYTWSAPGRGGSWSGSTRPGSGRWPRGWDTVRGHPDCDRPLEEGSGRQHRRRCESKTR